MSRPYHRVLLALALCLPLFASAQEPERLRVHGSNTLGARLMPALVEAWLRSIGYAGVQRVAVSAELTEVHASRDGAPLVVEIGRRGSASGMRALIAGDTELAMLARAPSAPEIAAGWQLGDLGSPDQQFVLALDGARLLVDARNPVTRLDVAQLREVLAGRVDNWNQLGGPDLPLRLVCADPAGGLGDYLRERVGAFDGHACSARHAGTREAAADVAGAPGALALVALTTPLATGTRALAISDGGIAVAPDPVAVRSEDYPLTQRYSLYGGQMMSALGRSLALYALGPAAQRIVAAQGLVTMALPAAPTAEPVPAGDALAAYRDAVAGAVRLPLSVHFDLQSLTSMFEGRSAQDLDRLVAWMQQPRNRGRALAVVGFANADAANKLFPTIASNDRADIVAGYLAQRGIVVQRARGLGALRPLVAPTAAQARHRNERVELWLL